VIYQVKSSREDTLHVGSGMVGTTLVPAGSICASDHEFSCDELPSFVRRQIRQIAIAVDAEKDVASRPCHPMQFCHPRALHVIGKVREHGEGIHEIELTFAIRERWTIAVRGKSREREVATAPIDEPAVRVGTVDPSRKASPMTNDSSAAAAEIQDRLH